MAEENFLPAGHQTVMIMHQIIMGQSRYNGAIRAVIRPDGKEVLLDHEAAEAILVQVES